MILYFTDRHMNILGLAGSALKEGLVLTDDVRTEDVNTGSTTLECDLNYTPENHIEAKNLTAVGNYILMETEDGTQEFYTIIETEDDSNKRTINLYAEDAGLDLLNEVVGEYTADKAHSVAFYINKFAYDSGFEIGVNEISDRSRTLSWDGEDTCAKRILSVATQFDAEVSYRFVIENIRVTHKYIDIWLERGQDSGEILRLNREIDSLTEKRSIADLATGLWVTGGTPDVTDANTDPQPITLNGYKYDDGDIYVSGTGIFCRSALSVWSRYVIESGTDVGHIMKRYSYDTTSQQELFSHAFSELQKCCEPAINYEIELTTVPKNFRIGDTVRIADEEGQLFLSARVLKLEVSECDKTQKATLGDYLIEDSGISSEIQMLQANFSKLAGMRVLHTWIAYAGDDEGANISRYRALTVVTDGIDEPSVAINESTFIDKVGKVGEYDFSYTASGWTLGGTSVSLADYGIALSVEPTVGDTIKVTYGAKRAFMGICPDKVDALADLSDTTAYAWSRIVDKPGAPVISLSSSGGVIFSGAIVTTLTAKVFRDGEELDANGIKKLGVLNWYDEDGAKVGTGSTLSVDKTSDENTVTSFTAYCRLESTSATVAESVLFLNSTQDIQSAIDGVADTNDKNLSELEDALRGEIDDKVSDLDEKTQDSIKESANQQAADMADALTDMKTQIDTAIAGNTEAITALKQWISFDENGGLKVGEGGTGYYIQIKGERIAFMYGDQEMYYLSNSKLYIKDAQVTNVLSFGTDTAQWAFVPRSNGNLSLRWIGE